MQKNEYFLFNGSPIEMSFSIFKDLIKSNQFKTPTFEEIVRFKNYSRFLADITCIYETKGIGIITINYGNSFDILDNRDVLHEYYNSFVHKNYPLILNGKILLSRGKIDLFLADSGCDNGSTRFESNIPERHMDIRDVQVVQPDENHKYVKILSQKNHDLGSITPPHLSKFTEKEMNAVKKIGIDYAHSMFLAWDASENEIDKAAKFQDEFEKSGGEVYKNPTYANAALTGKFILYNLEIDTRTFNVDQSNTVLFQDLFSTRVCLKKDYPDYIYDNSDYWVESLTFEDLIEEKFDIRTSFLLTNIQPEKTGKIKITVVDRLINDARSDHGYI